MRFGRYFFYNGNVAAFYGTLFKAILIDERFKFHKIRHSCKPTLPGVLGSTSRHLGQEVDLERVDTLLMTSSSSLCCANL